MSWDAFVNAIKGAKQGASRWYEDLQSIPDRAAEVSERAYPDSARDASTKNAFRHALGTGMLAHHLGGGPIASATAKAVGWGWEVPTLMNPMAPVSQLADSLHDLNANAIGARVARQTRDQTSLEAALRSYADRSIVSAPPSGFAPTPGWMTRSVR
jgi:hypothetical protein